MIGVPSSAAAHWPGQEKAPSAVRNAGFPERLRAAGVYVDDRGDLPVERWSSNRKAHDGAFINDLDRVVKIVERVADATETALGDDRFPVIVGGECTVTVGAFAGALRAGLDPSLIYIDGGWDLSTPATYPAGILDSMGAAHLLGIEGTTQLGRIGPRWPMLDPTRFVQYGHGTGAPDGADEHAARRLGLKAISAADAHGRGAEAAGEVLRIEAIADRQYLLHFDVDVIDFFDVPLADVPVHAGGLPYHDALAAVEMFIGDPRCAGLVVTELNPDHANPDGSDIDRLVGDLTRVIAPRA